MTGFRIDVDLAEYAAASGLLGQSVAGELASVWSGLTGSLSGWSGIAGSGAIAAGWAQAYDASAADVVGVLSDLRWACVQVAGMLEQTGFNYGRAEAASDSSRSVAMPPDRTQYVVAGPTGRVCVPGHDLPLSGGAGRGSPPAVWHLLPRVGTFLWPDADPGGLRAAGQAWTQAAGGLDSAAGSVSSVVRSVGRQVTPDTADAEAVLQALSRHSRDLAEACRAVGAGCGRYADLTEEAHRRLHSDLVELMEASVAIEAGGLVGAVFTLGAAELAAQMAEDGVITATAVRVARTMSDFEYEVGTAARTVANVADPVADLGRHLQRILGLRINPITVELVAPLPKLPTSDPESRAVSGLEVGAEIGRTNAELYGAYADRKRQAGQRPLDQAAWQRKLDTLARNKKVGAAYEKEVIQELGIRPGHDGWATQVPGPFNNRRYDVGNIRDSIGIEIKSGSSPTKSALTQLDKDGRAIRAEWTVTWYLRLPLNRTLMARLQQLATNYPDQFHYTIAER